MGLNFGMLAAATGGKITEPKKIFTTLARNPRFRRPSDEQGEVLDQWLVNKDRKDNTLKMNTGSGKTLVGLLILQSSLNEGVGPAVYVAPDNYLVSQVVQEARDLGIAVTEDANDAEFLSGRAILVVNVWKLINGKSVFGVGAEGARISIGAIIVDDAHACLASVEDQFSIKIDASHPLYGRLLDVFKDDLKVQSLSNYLDLEKGDATVAMAVPFWSWKSQQERAVSLIHDYREDKALVFSWPLLRDVLELCQCVFGGKSLEIAPRCLPIDMIPAFSRAKRRIYMTATLADDGILVSHFQADPASVADPLKPKGAGDIGDRMILAPQEINPAIKTDEIKQLAADIARSRNVVVIVPSGARAKYWDDVAAQKLDRENIGEGVEAMKRGLVGLSVFINKYDGIDLPGDACRLLIIDGLPETYGLIDRVEMTALDGTELQMLRQVQRIEQGMGRGVRSSEDFCVVLLLGNKLTQRIHMQQARNKFTAATLTQLDLGRAVTDQVRGQPLNALRPILDYCLNQDPQWVSASRSALVNAPETTASHIDPSIKFIREAFDAARIRRFDLASAAMQKAVNAESDDAVKGYLKLQLAEYEHHLNPTGAQEILLSAGKLNRYLTKPIQGISYSKLSISKSGQAAAASEFMTRFLEPNDLVIFVNALLEDLIWSEEGSKRFEAAIRDLGSLLGFGSQRPEIEVGKGPDNLWAVGELRYFLIECKSGATTGTIAKSDWSQLTSSLTWFENTYDKSCSAAAVIIHPSNCFDRYSTPAPETRVMEIDCLAELRRQLRSYASAIAASRALSDKAVIAAQLAHFGFTAEKFIGKYTKGFRVER